MNMKKIGVVGLLLFVVPFLSCISSSTRGASGGSNTTSDVATNLEAVSDNFTPDSLASGSASSTLKSQSGGEDPCAEATDLYDCQPILLRLYLDMAHMFLDMTQQIVSEIGTGLGSVADGTSGTETIEGETVHYSKDSATNFSLLMEGAAGPVAYFDVNETVYTLKMDLDNLEEAGDASGQLEIVVNYGSETSWSILIFIAGMDCDSSDPRAPERIHINVSRSADFWTGKAMFYNGRWLEDAVSCSTAETDARSINFYTDFVANEVAARASVYMMSRSKSDLSDIANFGMDNFSINFSSTPGNTSTYQNPFCNPATTLDALWNNDCASLDAAVAAQSYGSATDWILPSEFYLRTITLPSSL